MNQLESSDEREVLTEKQIMMVFAVVFFPSPVGGKLTSLRQGYVIIGGRL